MTHPEPESLTPRLAARVRDLRRAAGMSQTQLAERMTKLGFEWGRTTAQKLEAGHRASVSVGELLALALVFDFPPVLLIADPRRDESVPVAADVELDSWQGLLWLVGEVTATGVGRKTDAMRLISEGRAAVDALETLRMWQRVAGTRPDDQPTNDARERQALDLLQMSLEAIEELGAEPPRISSRVHKRAAELGVKLPGQDPVD